MDMKINKILGLSLLAGVMTSGLVSCTDKFLYEEQINARDISYFNTQEGLDDLITGAYDALTNICSYSVGFQSIGWGLCNVGIDEFTDANTEIPAMNGYSSLISTESTYIPGMWDNMYNKIEAVNLAIEKIPEHYNSSSPNFNVRMGEAHFLRAYCYFNLVTTYGGVPLKLASSKGVETYFVRNSEEECFAQILKDLETAYSLLPEKPAATGRITKYAAAHFLAKTHLFRASELYRGWNSKYITDDLNQVLKYAQEVVDAHPMCDDFVDLWDFTVPDGPNESVSEVVLAAQFTSDKATAGRFGNRSHLCFQACYQKLGGFAREISGGRDSSNGRTTFYTVKVFDRVNDSRFWKTFITTYGCNKPSAAPKWEKQHADAGVLPEGARVGDYRFKGNELGIRYILNEPGDTEYTPFLNESGAPVDGQVLRNGVMQPAHTYVFYYSGQDDNDPNAWVYGHGGWGNYSKVERAYFPAMGKLRDGSRESANSEIGNRDFILARSAEDVLMKAEAYARLNQLDNAIAELNKVRDRAGYKEGEDRSKHVDGGQAYKKNASVSVGGGYSADGVVFQPVNTYYESNKMEGHETTAETKSAMHLTGLEDLKSRPQDQKVIAKIKATPGEQFTDFGFSADQDYVLNFILNERTRELAGEYLRWIDLARQRALEVRYTAFNDAGYRKQGSFDKNKNYYRPIPQSFLDSLTDENGTSLSDEEKAAWQNPGY